VLLPLSLSVRPKAKRLRDDGLHFPPSEPTIFCTEATHDFSFFSESLDIGLKPFPHRIGIFLLCEARPYIFEPFLVLARPRSASERPSRSQGPPLIEFFQTQKRRLTLRSGEIVTVFFLSASHRWQATGRRFKSGEYFPPR